MRTSWNSNFLSARQALVDPHAGCTRPRLGHRGEVRLAPGVGMGRGEWQDALKDGPALEDRGISIGQPRRSSVVTPMLT